jgi:hypothetical protein
MDALTQAARDNVDRYLAELSPSAQEYDTVLAEAIWNLAHDGAVSAGAEPSQARIIAGYLRTQY